MQGKYIDGEQTNPMIFYGDNDNEMNPSEYGGHEYRYMPEYSPPKATLTICLIIINGAVWAAIMAYSFLKGIDFNEGLYIFGAKENLSIMQGQYWRFLTPIFLHASFTHLLVNSYSLYWVGSVTEKLYGHMKFLVIYLAAGIFGNILSFIFSPNPGVGASGSIFGLLGALLYFGIENPELFRRYFGHNIIITIAINVVYGFVHKGIDNYAHLGGLLGGFLASGIVKLRGTHHRWLKRPVFIILTLLVLGASLTYGFSNVQNMIILKVEQLDGLLQKGSYKEVDKIGKEILSANFKDDHIRLRTLWALVISSASQSKYSEAFEYADQIIELDAPRGRYMKGLLYVDTGNISAAKKELEEAKKLEPGLAEAVDKVLKEL